MNMVIKNRRNEGNRPYRDVTEHEFWAFIGILISAAAWGKGGEHLWGKAPDGAFTSFEDITTNINYGPKNRSNPDNLDIMSYQRFTEIKAYYPKGFEDHDARDRGDDWYKIRHLVNGFNENRSQIAAGSARKVFDESMSAIKPRTTKQIDLPNISYVKRKPKPLGTELKNVACGKTSK